MQRYYFVPYDKDNNVVDIGGYYDGTKERAYQQAYMLLCQYPKYKKIVIECQGEIVATVKP